MTYVYCVSLLSRVQLFCNPRDYSPPGSSVHGIIQARTLEWVAIPFSRASSQPRDGTQVSCIAGRFFIIRATREALEYGKIYTYTHTHTHRILLSHKKECNSAISSNIELENVIHSEVSQTKKYKHYMVSVVCGI